MEAVRSSEMLASTTRRYNPEEQHGHLHRRENLKSYIVYVRIHSFSVKD
jgi:hypothetical protein